MLARGLCRLRHLNQRTRYVRVFGKGRFQEETHASGHIQDLSVHAEIAFLRQGLRGWRCQGGHSHVEGVPLLQAEFRKPEGPPVFANRCLQRCPLRIDNTIPKLQDRPQILAWLPAQKRLCERCVVIPARILFEKIDRNEGICDNPEGTVRHTELFRKCVQRQIVAGNSLKQSVDVSRFDAAPLIAFIATKETNYGTETDGRIPC